MESAGVLVVDKEAIDRYRTATMSLDYLGDSVANSVGDIACCFAGFYLARALGLWKTLALFAAIELAQKA